MVANNPPVSDKSHSAGWTHKWAELLNAEVLKEWSALDLIDREVYVFNDLNTKKPGSMNLMGFKVDNEVGKKVQYRIDEITKVINVGTIVKQLDIHQLFHTAFTARGLVADKVLDNIPCILQTDLVPDKVVIGDSHSISVAPEGFAVNRNDGLTLFGALNRGLDSFLTGKETEVIFKLSDIDCRHHLCRQDDKKEATLQLLRDYFAQLCEIQKRGVKVSAVVPMPMVSDERKIPKTGFYKKAAYFGSLRQRNEIVKTIQDIMVGFFHKRNISVIDPYAYHTTSEGLLNMDMMEAGGSFHLAPLVI